MDKDKEVECGNKLRLNIFDTYWNIMKSNYKDTQHNEFEYRYYYSIFRDYDEENFKIAIKMVLKYQQYFPRIDEIVKYLPDIDNKNVTSWFDKEIKKEEITKEEQIEVEKIIEEIGG